MTYAETGHLCISTLHSNNAVQTLDRISNFFSEIRHKQLLMDLSINLKAIISIRLVRQKDGQGRVPIFEIMINTPAMSDLIQSGDILGIRELIAKSPEYGMQTFDQDIFKRIDQDEISVSEGLRHADSINDLRLRLKLEGKDAQSDGLFQGTESLSMEEV